MILLLLCLFGIVWMQVDVSLGEDEEILQHLLFFLPHSGVVSFIYYVQFVLLVALIPFRVNPWWC